MERKGMLFTAAVVLLAAITAAPAFGWEGPAPTPKARLAPVTRGRAASLKPVTRGRAASMKGISSGRAANLAPVTRGRAASLAPVTRGRAASLNPISSGRAAGLAPVTRDRAAALAPVASGRAVGLNPISSGRAAGLMPVTRGRAAALAPVTTARAARLTSISTDWPAHFDSALLGLSAAPLFVGTDGFIAPYEAMPLVRDGFFRRGFGHQIGSPYHWSRGGWGANPRFRRARLGPVCGYRGSVFPVLDAIDPYGPHRFWRAPMGYNVPAGIRRGSFYFPAAFYLRPLRFRYSRGFRYNKGHRLILVPRDIVEVIPEDFYPLLRDSHFPMVIGDVAFKDGDYVKAALSFREAFDRNQTGVASRFALGDALVALRNYAYASDAIRSGLEASPRWADNLDRHGVYGNDKEGDLERHLTEVAEYTEKYPKSHRAWFLLGYLQMTSGEKPIRAKAPLAFRRALDIEPDDPIAWRYLELLTEPNQSWVPEFPEPALADRAGDEADRPAGRLAEASHARVERGGGGEEVSAVKCASTQGPRARSP